MGLSALAKATLCICDYVWLLFHLPTTSMIMFYMLGMCTIVLSFMATPDPSDPIVLGC